MPQTVQIRQYGGPEQMQLVDLPVGEPGPGPEPVCDRETLLAMQAAVETVTDLLRA